MFEGQNDTMIVLYRAQQSHRRVRKLFLKRFYNEIPFEEDIAREFGAREGENHYIAVTSHPVTKKILSKDIFLDPSWHKEHLKWKALQEPEDEKKSAPVPVNQDPLVYSGQIISQLIKPMMELFKMKNPQPQSQDSIAERWIEIMTGGMKKMQTAMIDQQVTQLTAPKPEPEDTTKLDLVKEFLGVIKTYGERFLQSKGLETDAMKAMINNHPGVQEIQQDDTAYNLLYQLGIEDPDIGQEKISRIFKKAGFDVPEETSTNTEGVNENLAPGGN